MTWTCSYSLILTRGTVSTPVKGQSKIKACYAFSRCLTEEVAKSGAETSSQVYRGHAHPVYFQVLPTEELISNEKPDSLLY